MLRHDYICLAKALVNMPMDWTQYFWECSRLHQTNTAKWKQNPMQQCSSSSTTQRKKWNCIGWLQSRCFVRLTLPTSRCYLVSHGVSCVFQDGWLAHLINIISFLPCHCFAALQQDEMCTRHCSSTSLFCRCLLSSWSVTWQHFAASTRLYTYTAPFHRHNYTAR